ncbi:MAG: response regulator [Bacillati bacterium ANGP1]|uniref:histidine kinase n=1 Tax=Candidatus Segetimicrobium genomatis TaxID=2569760 RepID=A0A537JFH6_9BACT|nr:MAG: response regulator [Terrabacteria group bacterium ANGP1]
MDHLSAEQHEGVEQILRGGRHLLGLIDEVLDIAKIEAGRLALSTEPVRISEELQETLDLIEPMATARNVLINGDRQETCRRHVLADRQRLKQVLLNLLSNAVKYNRPGGTVTLSCQESGNGRLRVKVTDTGPGIPADKMERLFTPFDRLGAEQSEVEGTGLGLSLSKRLAEAMGGTLGIESTPGLGSTFWLELTVVESPLERFEKAREPITAPAAGTPAAAARVVLYIEDNFSNLRLIERLLARRPEIRLIPAMQGRLGVQLAREHRPDLILLDLQLPDISGHDVLRHLREAPETRDTRIIVISADATPGQIDRLVAAGAWRYLTKPLDVKKCLALLDEALATPETGRAGRDA